MKPAPPTLDFCAPVKLKKIRLAICADWHYGSQQCNEHGVRRFVKRIADDPACWWVGAGDLAENALIQSLGDVYRQKISPQDQVYQLVDILEPIKDRCLGMISGNHGYRTEKQAGLDPDRVLAALLEIEDRYFGISIQGRIRIGESTNWLLAVHHCTGGGRTKGGKLGALARMAEIWPVMDLYIGAHHHADQYASDRVKRIEIRSGSVAESWKTRHFTGAGSALDYSGSYAERKLMPPAAICQVVLELGARVDHRHSKGKKQPPDRYLKPLSREVFHL